MTKDKAQFKVLIDTLQISTDINNVVDYTKINNDIFEYVERTGDNFDNAQMKIKLNPHTKYGEGTIDKLHKHNNAVNEMLMEIGIVEVDEVNMNRIDIAFDSSDYEYVRDFKLMLFTYELMTVRRGKKDSRWYTTNINTLMQNSIKLYGDKFDLEIYDKKEESKGTHPYNVRFEFRYKRLDRLNKTVDDSDIYINKTMDRIKGMEGNLEHLEANMTDRLLTLYEMKKDEVLSFSEFVRRYNEYFYTLNILKSVYKGVGLKGSYSEWLKKFRKTNTLEFYSKSDIKEVQRAMLRSAKAYMKNR